MADPEALRQAITGEPPAPALAAPAGEKTPAGLVKAAAGSDLAALVTHRVTELVAYQNPAYARRYAEFVEQVRRAEDAAVPGSTRFTEAVAFSLHKLMAYKDEYEVARLILDDGFGTALRREFGPDATCQVRLHPPLLRALGLKRKIALGPAWHPVFRILHALRRLRGTRLDLFGRSLVRRTERALINEYRHEIENLLPRLAPETLPTASGIAALPDLIRGYESIKLTAVTRYREKLTQLHAKLATGPQSSIEFQKVP